LAVGAGVAGGAVEPSTEGEGEGCALAGADADGEPPGDGEGLSVGVALAHDARTIRARMSPMVPRAGRPVVFMSAVDATSQGDVSRSIVSWARCRLADNASRRREHG
jgi:hypothetical protein